VVRETLRVLKLSCPEICQSANNGVNRLIFKAANFFKSYLKRHLFLEENDWGGANRTMFEESNMVVLIEMPLTIYQAFLGRCVLGSRESELLRNSVLSHAPVYVRFGNVVECRYELEDAELL
jgi:hypothetical protein